MTGTGWLPTDAARTVQSTYAAKPAPSQRWLASNMNGTGSSNNESPPITARPAPWICASPHDALHKRNRRQGIRPEQGCSPQGQHDDGTRGLTGASPRGGENRPRDGKRRNLGGIGLREQDDRNHDWAVDGGTPAAPRVVQVQRAWSARGWRQRAVATVRPQSIDGCPRYRDSRGLQRALLSRRRRATARHYSPVVDVWESPPRHTTARPGPRRPRSDSTGSSKAQPNASRRRPLREPGAVRPPARPGAKAYSRGIPATGTKGASSLAGLTHCRSAAALTRSAAPTAACDGWAAYRRAIVLHQQARRLPGLALLRRRRRRAQKSQS